MAFTPDTLTTLAAREQGYPLKFGSGREAHLAKITKTYVDAKSGGLFAPVLVGTVTSIADASSPFESTHTVTGLLTTDFVVATVRTRGVSTVLLTRAQPTATNTLVLEYSADPGVALTITYVVFRAT